MKRVFSLPPPHVGEVPCWLRVLSPATTYLVILLSVVMIPVVRDSAGRLLRIVHTIETQPIEVGTSSALSALDDTFVVLTTPGAHLRGRRINESA